MAEPKRAWVLEPAWMMQEGSFSLLDVYGLPV